MIAIKNGRLVLPDRVQDGKILVLADDRIRGIEDEIPQGAGRVIDAHGPGPRRGSTLSSP